MTNEQGVFRFELNESLYFEKGQEVSEMLGISLDPEISIQPFHEYISIRGVIELQGEYQKVDTLNELKDEVEDFDDFHSKRYVERVMDREDGQVEFVHRFPVEISVPTYRVSDINDITVSVESFDYELPNHSQLNLNSVIEINGIRDEEQEEEDIESSSIEESVEESAESEAYAASQRSEEEDEFFEFEINQTQEELNESSSVNESIDTKDTPPLSSDFVEDKDDHSNQEKEKDRWKYKETQSLKEFFQKDDESSSVESPSLEDTEGESTEVIWNESHSPSIDFDESPNIDSNDESESDEIRDVGYLADMFRDEEEDTYTKMKLCIVQGDDSLESIAEKYNVSKVRLVKQNRLTDDEISEGQLLYIPVK
ncbi:stage VI sporulation protein D [Oceanobacillus halotolerans]|uniref:stage VI sporulation protein D n=1 Tax=Oceanobacillus halotolerans TaxID=2663380 RepID=UPI001CF7B11F|nr:stage VI sporulation protein D [Oceanobacillus halotolerans]